MRDCHQFSTVKVKASLFLLLGLEVFVSPVLCRRPAAPLLKGQKLFEELSQSGRRVGLNVCSTENLKLQRWARELRRCGCLFTPPDDGWPSSRLLCLRSSRGALAFSLILHRCLFSSYRAAETRPGSRPLAVCHHTLSNPAHLHAYCPCLCVYVCV